MRGKEGWKEGGRRERERERRPHMLDSGHCVSEVTVVWVVFGGDREQLHQQTMVLVDPLYL